MNEQYLTQKTFHAFLSEIIHEMKMDEEEELVEYQYEMLMDDDEDDEDDEVLKYYKLFVVRNTPHPVFFRDSTVTTCDKVKIMFMMSRDNLKFHELENVDDNNHQQLHRLLIMMFSETLTEDNELRMVHVLACMVNKKSDNVIANLIDTSTTERQAIFMEMMGHNEHTALHLACHYNASIGTINALIAIGGRELVMTTDADEDTALHLAIQTNASIGTINALIAIGGRELVMTTYADGYTTLHLAIQTNASIDTIDALIAIGGRELVMMNDKYKDTALHLAIQTNASIGTIDALIAIGGRELVMMIDTDGYTALHFACIENASIDTINALIAIGGNLLLTTNDNEGNSPLFTLLDINQPDNRINKVSSLIFSGIIQGQVGGEFGIGGLFNFASKEGQQRIFFQHWNNTILPALGMNAALISRQPILQAAIIAKAPLHIIQDIISRFNCIATQDSRGRYPIDVAVAEGLGWGDGMEDIVRAHVAVESMEEVGNADALTGLFPFMLAAAGQSSDLSSIYELMLQVLILFKDSCKY